MTTTRWAREDSVHAIARRQPAMIGRVYRTSDGRYWRVLAAGAPFDRGPRRNVLLERVQRVKGPTVGLHWWPTGERVVRPFRGLRRA